MRDISIRDLYVGKPDAKDEINFEKSADFIKAFVVADHFRIDSLLHGTNCFITGSKGTGKTALLFYLDNMLKENDMLAWSSFILFKEDYSEIKKNELQAISRRILSSLSVDSDVLINNDEFEHIWRWQFFKRIIEDNESANGNLFVDDMCWDAFVKKINQIKGASSKKKSIIPQKIRIALPCKDPSSVIEIAPEVEVDLGDLSSNNYHRFVSLIEEAETLFYGLTRTDVPYYIFVDELEAYYGDKVVFLRDLHMVRDLIFTVKRFNTIFAREKMANTKIICSVRTEVLNAVSRFTVSKEINKTIVGFCVPLQWTYTNTSSYMHPIIKVLLKRIAVFEENKEVDYKEIYENWFPERIHGLESARYILDNSWCKPRDMVRLLRTAQNSIHNNSTVFSQAVFDDIRKAYSLDSLEEIKEELRALYDLSEIQTIINCFVGYKTAFSVSQLKLRIATYFAGSVLEQKFDQVIEDLYRLGFLGNYLPASKTYRWQHKEDPMVSLTGEWRLCVHYALHAALSLGSRANYDNTQGMFPEIGDAVNARVTKITDNYVFLRFTQYGYSHSGRIQIDEFQRIIPQEGNDFTGVEVAASLVSYSKKYKCWNLRIISKPSEDKY